ncbi:MAG: hypothetical protein LQ348_006274 [Seirophora lacunosa]|nr:MAG: hypothetical protein LQ348_006274 [Seirophora lacunosa]
MSTTPEEMHRHAASSDESQGRGSSTPDYEDTTSSSTAGASATCSLLSFSTPVTDGADPRDRVNFTAFGKNLPILSRLLATNRQVDIEFSQRQALIVFLMERLEIAHWTYAREKFPQQMEALHILSADQLDLPAWKAFVSELNRGDFRTKRNKLVYEIRHIAVHRRTYDTNIVKAAVIEAEFLGDGRLTKQIDVILRVLYADAAHDSRFTVTQRQRRSVQELLWPIDRPVETMHQLLDKVQSLGETVSFAFCQRHLSRALHKWDVTEGAHLELSDWIRIIQRPDNWDSSDAQAQTFRDAVIAKLDRVSVDRLRNAAAHRRWYEITDAHEAGDLHSHIQRVIDYVRILGDEGIATRIERLRDTTLELLHPKLRAWMDPSWLDNRDWQDLYGETQFGWDYWEGMEYQFQKSRVDVHPLSRLYCLSLRRIEKMVQAKGLDLMEELELASKRRYAEARAKARHEPEPEPETEEQIKAREERARWWREQTEADYEAAQKVDQANFVVEEVGALTVAEWTAEIQRSTAAVADWVGGVKENAPAWLGTMPSEEDEDEVEEW